MEQYGTVPKSKSFRCPFCNHKNKAGLFKSTSGNELFKCHSPSCPSAPDALDEVGFIALKSALSREDAFEAYLKMAGVWRERETLKSPTPEPAESPDDPGPDDADAESEFAPADPVVVPFPISPPDPPAPEAPPEERPPPPPEPEPAAEEEVEYGLPAVRQFYAHLTLSAPDEEKLFTHRGLSSSTSHALGFVSAPKANKQFLDDLEFPPDELVASSLWVQPRRPKVGPAKPNAQFYGFGLIGKKVHTHLEDGAPPDEEEFTWGWTYPVLIPYVDRSGRIQSLRPHKGMGRRGTLMGTLRVYVPRPVGQAAGTERFNVVVITEGEFKAAVLWQFLGAGSGEKYPIGVCSLPGISMAKNYGIRQQLEGWLKAVGCRRVKVAFDSEDKGNPDLPGYKADPKKRHDAQIWARYLATDLSRRLHIGGEVVQLPVAWRNKNGKADWDGAAAMLLQSPAPAA